MIAPLKRLAAAIDADWRAAGSKPGSFPQIAARALAAFQAHRHCDLNALAEWILRSRHYPEACNPFGPLGPPAFTIWSNGAFFVNVYAYTTPEVVIHDHNFAGAFVNAAGRSIHCTYRFDRSERIDAAVQVGTLELAETEIVTPGLVRQIEPGAAFIHQVWHVSQPTVVLVVRTAALPRRSLRQFEYFRPAVATEIVRDDTRAAAAPQRFRYTRKMLQCLRATGDGVPYLTRLIEREPPWDAIWHLVENWQLLRANGVLDDVLRRGAKQHGRWFAAMEGVAARAGLFYAIDWRRITAEQDRIVLALLLTLGSWPELARVFRSLLPSIPAEDAVLESLRRLSAQRAIPLVLSDDRLGLLLCALRSRGERRAWRQLVRDTFELDGANGWAQVRRLERELGEQELLKPLLNFG